MAETMTRESAADRVPSKEQMQRAITRFGDAMQRLISDASPRLITLEDWANLGTLKRFALSDKESERKAAAKAIVERSKDVEKKRNKITKISFSERDAEATVRAKLTHLESHPEDLPFLSNTALAIALTTYGPAHLPNIASYINDNRQIPAFGKKWTLTPAHRVLLEEYNRRIVDSERKSIEHFRAVRDKDGFTVGFGDDAVRVVKSPTADRYLLKRKGIQILDKEFRSDELEEALEAAWKQVGKGRDNRFGSPGIDDVTAAAEDPRDARIRALEDEIAELRRNIGSQTSASGDGRMAAGLSDLAAPAAAAAVHADTHGAGGHEAHEAGHEEEHGDEDTRTRIRRDLLSRVFAERAGFREGNVDRYGAAVQSVERLRSRGKRFFLNVMRGMIAPIAGFAAWSGAVALGAFSGGLIPAILGVMAVSGSAMLARGTLNYSLNKRYGIETTWKDAFIPDWFRSKAAKAALGKTRFTYPEMADMAGGVRKLESALKPKVKAYEKAEEKLQALRDSGERLVAAGYPDIPPTIKAQIAAMEREVAVKKSAIGNFTRYRAAFETGVGRAKVYRVGTEMVSALAGGVSSYYIRNGIMTALSAAPSGTPALAPTPAPALRPGGGVSPLVGGHAAPHTPGGGFSPLTGGSVGHPPSGGGMAPLSGGPVVPPNPGPASVMPPFSGGGAGHHVMGAPVFENGPTFEIACKSHGKFVAHTWDAVGKYLQHVPRGMRSAELQHAMSFFEHGHLGNGRPRTDFVKDIFDASLDSGRSSRWAFSDNEIIKFMREATRNPQFQVGMDLNSMPNHMQFRPQMLFGNQEYMGRLAEKIINTPDARFPGGSQYKKNMLDIIAGLYDTARQDVVGHAAAKAALRIP